MRSPRQVTHFQCRLVGSFTSPGHRHQLEETDRRLLVSPPSERQAFTGSGHSTATGRTPFEQILQLYYVNASLLNATIIIRLYTYMPHMSVACPMRRLSHNTCATIVSGSKASTAQTLRVGDRTQRRCVPVVEKNIIQSYAMNRPGSGARSNQQTHVGTV